MVYRYNLYHHVAAPSPTKKAKGEAEGVIDVADYSKMKVAELKEELELRGLNATGKKTDLISRLEDDDSGATSKYKNDVG